MPAKELYLYSPLYDFVSEDCMRSMEAAGSDDVCIRMNCPGGNVLPAYGIAAKMNERSGKTTIKVDGSAMSMGAMLLCFADEVEALDVSTIMLHRASYGEEYDRTCTAEEKAFLDKVNNDLRAKLTAKIDVKKLKELKGVSIKNIFEDEKRIDLYLTGKEAKAIGLVDRVNTLTAKELSAFNAKMHGIAAIKKPIQKPTIKKKKIMAKKITAEALMARYPKTCAKIFGMGVEQEKERVDACLVFMEVDPKGVKKVIASGKTLSQKEMAEFSMKQNSPEALKKLKAEAAGDVTTTETEQTEKTEKEKELSAFETQLRGRLKLKKDVK